MTIRTKLLLATLLELLLVVTASLFFIHTSQQIKQSTAKQDIANRIVQDITEIRFVTFENLLYHNERTYQQWQLKHQSLTALLESMPPLTAAEKLHIDRISSQHKAVEPVFKKLAASYQQLATGLDEASLNAYRDTLSSQLVSKQQLEIADAFKLAALEQTQIDSLHAKANTAVAIIILLMFLIMVVDFLLITANVNKGLAALQRGADEISGGKLDYRIKTKRHNDEFGRLARAFNAMAESYEKIDTVKSELILLVSHQLRTPLTAIKWSVQSLLSPPQNLTEEEKTHKLQQINNSNERMIKIVNELLDASKVGLNSLAAVPKQVNVAVILAQVIETLSPLISKQDIKINQNVDKTIEIMIDPAWLQLILQNLLTNAIQYSPSGQAVTVTIAKTRSEVLIQVEDNGSGIPKDQQTKIFTKLFRATNARQMIGEGSGLGLYVAKAMAKKAGGTIWFTSVEGQGSTFFVKLPLPR